MNYWERQQAESIARWKDEKELGTWRPWMRKAKPEKPEPRGKVCRECFMEMPLVGGCQNC